MSSARSSLHHEGLEAALDPRRKSGFHEEAMKPRKSLALSAEERATLNEAFAKVVGTKPGIGSVQELRELMDLVNEPTDAEELTAMFVKADTNSDGMLELDEFVNYLEERKLRQHMGFDDSELMQTFVAFGGNTDLTGTVDVDSILTLFRDFELVFEIAPDAEKEVNFHGFRRLFGQLLSQRHFRAPSFAGTLDI